MNLDRRDFLFRSACGFGGVALGWLCADEARAAALASPYAPKPPMFPAKAKRVIHICALGGVSHVDTFDYKPELERRHGQDSGRKFDTFFSQPGRLLKSPFAFRQYGASGRWVSDLLPHLAGCVDDLTFIHSMHSKSSNHTPATFLMNSGFTFNGFPSAGAWVSYGLGSENQNLPAYVVLPDPRQLPAGGSINWSNGFLPAVHQGVAFRSGERDPIPDLATPSDISPARREASVRFLEKLNAADAAAHPGDSALAARIRAYELAAQMQLRVPELVEQEGSSGARRGARHRRRRRLQLAAVAGGATPRLQRSRPSRRACLACAASKLPETIEVGGGDGRASSPTSSASASAASPFLPSHFNPLLETQFFYFCLLLLNMRGGKQNDRKRRCVSPLLPFSFAL